MAKLALKHCAQTDQNLWCLATQGEAYLMLGDVAQAEVFYRKAIAKTGSPRELQSMYAQAIQVALRVGGDDAGRTIEQVFGVAELKSF